MAVGTHIVFPGFLTPGLTQLSFQSHRLLFSHASEEVRGENKLERRFVSTRYQTHNHQVMSVTCSPLSYPGGAQGYVQWQLQHNRNKVENGIKQHTNINKHRVSSAQFY